MKKILLPAFIAATLTLSCGNKTATGNTQNNGVDSVDTTESIEEKSESVERLSTDSSTFNQEGKRTRVEVKVEYPTSGSDALKNILCEFISEELGGTYKGDVSDVKTMVKYYGKQAYNDLTKERNENEDNADAFYEKDFYVKKIYETNTFVTFSSQNYVMTGGAHGGTTSIATTFRKSDGRRFGTDMLRNTGSEGFCKLLKEGFRQYFTEMTGKAMDDEELQQQIITDNVIDALPLPVTPPYLTNKGVAYTYQQYELVCYAAGMPGFTIPYSKMRPYLTQTVLKMVEGK